MRSDFAKLQGIVPLLLTGLLLGACGGGEEEATPEEQGGQDTTAAAAPADPLMDPLSPEMTATAPEQYTVLFNTSKGEFEVQVTRSWAPLAADRFYNLARNGFYNETRFFRMLPGFIVQWGLHGDPFVTMAWQGARMQDDPVTQSNDRGTVTFAMGGPNSRTTQVFVNLADNGQLDGMGFAPFGRVTGGMDVVDSFYAEYGEGAPNGSGPDQARMRSEGNAYLQQEFPNLDYVISTTVTDGPAAQ